MLYYTDLHIHSKYSRATSKSCNLEELAFWAKKKGLSLISTVTLRIQLGLMK